MMGNMLPEPWLRGPVADLDPLIAPILYAFEQAREDLARYTEPLAAEQLWVSPHGFGSVGFHIRHIAGSTERLMAYLQGRQLTAEQLAEVSAEMQPLATGREELLAILCLSFRDAEAVVRAIDPATLREPRFVGRKRLPTTVIGLLTHIAEHTQRHVGQAIMLAKFVAQASRPVLHGPEAGATT
jgi:uncharacterized damage-inducible protein DinB